MGLHSFFCLSVSGPVPVPLLWAGAPGGAECLSEEAAASSKTSSSQCASSPAGGLQGVMGEVHSREWPGSDLQVRRLGDAEHSSC